jgi:hypothetical protein
MRIFVVAVLLLFTTLLCAQSSPATPPQKLRSAVALHPEWPKSKPADVDTIGDIVRAFYSAISAPAGGKLDQNRLLSLFVPGGRMWGSFAFHCSGRILRAIQRNTLLRC